MLKASTMTPDEFAEEIRKCFPEGDYDKEGAHAFADDIMCDLLESLGYKEGIDIFRKANKWYA